RCAQSLEHLDVVLEYHLNLCREVGIRVNLDCGVEPLENALKLAFDLRPVFAAKAGKLVPEVSQNTETVFGVGCHELTPLRERTFEPAGCRQRFAPDRRALNLEYLSFYCRKRLETRRFRNDAPAE